MSGTSVNHQSREEKKSLERERVVLDQKEIPIVLIEGDGIGKEISKATVQVLDHALSSSSEERSILWKPALAGVQAREKTGVLLPDETRDLFLEHGVGIKGPLETPIGGGFRSINVALRKLLNLYANIRPIRSFDGLKNPVVTADDMNMIIFRENTEDIYAGLEFRAGTPEAKRLADFLELNKNGFNPDSAIGIKLISEKASRRIVHNAVQYALKNGFDRITLVHKGNIMKYTEGAFRDWGYDEAAKLLGDRYLPWDEYNLGGRKIPPGKILVQDRIADAMFVDLIRSPKEHQLLVTMNLNGDYLSDAAAGCVGGLGLAPGINTGDGIAMAEAVHGTAPDIAGRGIANPTALILSGMLLFKNLHLDAPAALIEKAIEESYRRGDVTGDLARRHQNPNILNTSTFADALCKRIDELKGQQL